MRDAPATVLAIVSTAAVPASADPPPRIGSAHEVADVEPPWRVVPEIAGADPRGVESAWRIDVTARGIASIEVADAAPRKRTGVVPALGLRVERAVGHLPTGGRVLVGGALGAGFPAYHGEAELVASIDLEHVLREPGCALVRGLRPGDGGLDDVEVPCRGARWTITAGADAGLGMLYHDAPPETSASSDALIYWGPLGRVRVQLHLLSVRPNGRAIGVVVGTGVAASAAHYMSTAAGTGVRLMPELEVGLATRL